MNYELAKKLKDAGFPEQTRIAAELNLHRYRPLNEQGDATFPFLQELLNEVPFCLLIRGDGEWAACSDSDVWIEEKSYADTPENIASGHAGKTYHSGYIDTGNILFQAGATPEEAVANLWLALNRKS